MNDGTTPKKRKRDRRRARGTGSIFLERGENGRPDRWVGRIPIGRTPAGAIKYRELRAPTQAELIKRMSAAGPPGAETTVADWSGRWLATLTVRPSTMRAYRLSISKHLVPAIGHRRLTDVTAGDVELLAAKFAREMAPGSLHRILAAARGMFSAAVRAGVLTRNPVALAKKPKRVAKKITPFSPEQLVGVIGLAGAYAAGPVLATMAGIGCRVGEALALDVTDWDPAARMIRITKTFSRAHGLGPPKSPHSVRTIAVPDVLAPVLDAAVAGRTAGPLFLTANGNRMIQDRVDVNWRSILKRLGLARCRSHVMRHSVATLLIAKGVPVGDVARYLGDSVATICQVYLHPTGTNPADALNVLYGGREVGNVGAA